MLPRIKGIFLLFIFSLYPQTVLADYGEQFFYINCDQENKTFEFEPFIVWNDKLDEIIPTLERNGGQISSGSHKLFRMRGQGVDESCKIGNANIRIILPKNSNKLKLYENNTLIASPKIDNVWGGYGYIYQVRFTPTTKWEEFCGCEKTICNKELTTKWKPLNFKRPDANCENSVSDSDKPFDALSNFHYTNKPMIFQTLVERNDVCKIALKKINNDFLNKSIKYNDSFKKGKGKFVAPNGEPWKEFSNPDLFDFDNDGITDRIFYYSSDSHYLYGDIFYVAYGNKNATIEKSELSISDIYIFPCRFDPSVTLSSSCPTISQDADGAGINVTFGEDNESVFFRGRYTVMTPMIYNNKTYIILRSHSQDTELFSAVIYPFNKTKFECMCLFKRQP